MLEKLKQNCQMITMMMIVLGVSKVEASEEISPQQLEFFEKKIRPVLAETCYECHNSIDKSKGDIALDYKKALDESGIIVRGKPDESDLILSIRHHEDYEAMPSKKPKLPDDVIADFEKWIKMGAPDPRLKKPTKEELENQVDWDATREKRKEWWSFQAIKKPASKSVSNKEWDKTAIDRFIYSSLEKNGLEPQKKAKPEVLIRRLYLILLGYPPKPEVVERFVKDPSEEKYSALVDELLASKAYAERWARYWMDWYRYAESHGSEGDARLPYASEYRSYLIRALHQDVSYKQLLKEHIAGDLLKSPRVDKKNGVNESKIGLAHLRMMPVGFGVTDAYNEQIVMLDNKIDVVSKAMLGVTVSCARCHNHKFDPISQKDFYKFYGVFASSRDATVNIDSDEMQQLNVVQINKLKLEMREKFADYWLGQMDKNIDGMAKMSFEGKDSKPSQKKKKPAQKSKTIALKETDPLYAWAKLRDLEDAKIQRALAGLARRHESVQERKQKAISSASYYADLRDQRVYDTWSKDGNGVSKKVTPAGEFIISEKGNAAFLALVPRGVYSGLSSTKHNGFITSPYHTAKGNVNAMIARGENAVGRFSMRGYPLSHGGLHPTTKLQKDRKLLSFGKYSYWNGDKGYYQINTGADSTVGVSGPRAWFGVSEVYAGKESFVDTGHPLFAFTEKWKQVDSKQSLLQLYRKELEIALEGWKIGKVSDGHAILIDSMLRQGILEQNLTELPDSLSGLVRRYRELEAEIRVPRRAPGVVEAEVIDQPLLKRGDYRTEAEAVKRGFLEVFDGREYSDKNSGRLELAEDMVAENNTLTSRVIVNRLWHHIFGKGIVSSVDNFGLLGAKPSHPELLDYLSSDFVEHDWKLKRMVRKMVMSRTFRSASVSPTANGVKDQPNHFLAYYPARRLDAEAIYDTIMSVSNQGSFKRAVYTDMMRNKLNPFLKTFNLPLPTTTVGARNLTNVPSQALTLLNGGEVNNAAKLWAGQLAKNKNLSDTEIVEKLFAEAYSRQPTQDEMKLCLEFLGGGEVEDDKSRALIAKLEKEVAELSKRELTILNPVRKKLLKAKENDQDAARVKEIEAKPIAHWDFSRGLNDLVGDMNGELKGKASLKNGALELAGGAMFTRAIDRDLKERTLKVTVELAEKKQRGGGVMVLQDAKGVVFDGVVYGEIRPGQWLSGSNHHRRSFHAEVDQVEKKRKRLQLIYVYKADGTIIMYRNGERYGNPGRKGPLQGYKTGNAHIVFGSRHGIGLSANRAFHGKIYEAKLYNSVLSEEDIQALAADLTSGVSHASVLAALTPSQKKEYEQLQKELNNKRKEIEKYSPQKAPVKGRAGNLFRLTHAILNSKELIYVH